MKRFWLVLLLVGLVASPVLAQGDVKVVKQSTRYLVELSLDSKVLSWSIVPSENVKITPTGDMTATADLVAGSYTVTAWPTTTTGRTLKVVVGSEPIPPTPNSLIESFTITPSTIKKGETAKLTWTASKAKTATLQGITVSVTGSQEVKPDTTTTYLLVVSDGLKIETAQRILTVSDTPPPPPPNTKWQVMFITETGDLAKLPAGQRAILASLTFRKDMESKGHRFLGAFDKDMKGPDGKVPVMIQPWFLSIQGDTLPRIAIAPIEGGDIKDFPLPADETAVLKLLEKGSE